MPKTVTRRWLNLLAAFGVKGADEDLRFPLSGSIAPVINADAYDPLPVYGFTNVQAAGGAGNFNFLEIQARPWARIVALALQTPDSVALRRRSAFTAGGAALVGAQAFTSDGSIARATAQNGFTAAPQGGCLISPTTGFPPVVPIHWEGVIRVEHQLANAGFIVSVFFQELPVG